MNSANLWIDSHAHLDFESLADVTSQIPWIEGVLIPAISPNNWERIWEICHQHPGKFWGSIGFHPQENSSRVWEQWEAGFFKKSWNLFLEKPEILAIGEAGLDQKIGPDISIQKSFFEMQIQQAILWDKLLIIHLRGHHDVALEILKKYPKLRAQFHCYSGSAEMALRYLDALPNAYFSFGGPITYPEARRAKEAILKLPKDRLVIETDSPDLIPAGGQPSSSERPNTPQNIAVIGAALAGILQNDERSTSQLTRTNVKRMLCMPITAPNSL